jgi:hypothetical protein
VGLARADPPDSRLPGDDGARLAVGTRVRVTVRTGRRRDSLNAGETRRHAGYVRTLDDSTLTLIPPVHPRSSFWPELAAAASRRPVVISRADVVKVETSAGRRSRGVSALKVTAAFALFGLALGIADHRSEPSSFTPIWAPAVLLAPIGAIAGAAAPPGERWRTVPPERLRLALAPMPAGGARVTVSLGF